MEGVFSFKLQLYECDDLSSSSLDCGPVSDITETIAVDITLDTVVQVSVSSEVIGLHSIRIVYQICYNYRDLFTIMMVIGHSTLN